MAARHLARHEGSAPPRRLVVEQDPVRGVEAVGSRYWTVIQWAKTFAIA